MNGEWEHLRIVGIALSTEYIYQIRGSKVFPDNRRFGILWMSRDVLGPLDRRQLCPCQAHVHGNLPPVMNMVEQFVPQRLAQRDVRAVEVNGAFEISRGHNG